ncbi:MAG TPA: AMP-binding protein [Acidimicrobiales bacterium]|nr:AMP-binding protein [Acidimicrobiales bacterium]
MRPRSWREHLPSGSEFQVGDLTARRSLPAAWSEVWAADPAAPLLLESGAGESGAGEGGSGGPARWITAGELDERSRRAAGVLQRLGLGPGDRMLWSTGSSVAAVVANIAALRAGLVVVPANAAYTARELAHIVTDVRPAAAVVDDPDRARWVAEAAPGALVVLSVDLETVSGERPGSTPALRTALDTSGPQDPALIGYSSGTTGAPKGAVLSHGNLLANSESVALTWRWQADDRLVHALPIFHGHGLCVALYTSLLRGSSVVLLPRFDATAVLDAVSDHNATLFFGVPTMYHRLAASPRVGELARLRLAVSGSAPLAADLHRRIAQAGGTDVLERYGMTETLMTISNPYDGERRPGTVGFGFPGTDVRLHGEEILVRGPTVFAGYWQRPAATAEKMDDGWLRTGDLATVDDGYVAIMGRSSDLIVSGGYNVYPVEVEDVLLRHPAVAEVAVTGTPSDEWGEAVTAWVVPDGPPPTSAELAAFTADLLAPYKRPRLLHIVDALPRNALGKVRRVDLR